MPPQNSSPLSDPLYMVLARKLVLLLLLMLTTTMGLVALIIKARLSMNWLVFLLADIIIGLVAGFSIRWIIPKKFIVLRIGSALAFIIGSLALLRWFTKWNFGINFLRAGGPSLDLGKIGQILLATCIALLSLHAWRHSKQSPAPIGQSRSSEKLHHTRGKPEKQLNHSPKTQSVVPTANQTKPPTTQKLVNQFIKPKRKRAKQSKPKLVLSKEEEHRCPYCLELIDPNDKRGAVECEICHTLHHADCWAITGACQVPHLTT
jgi:hypothetical protein